MAEAIAVVEGAESAAAFIEPLFKHYPEDFRYKKVGYSVHYPMNSYKNGAKHISVQLPAWNPAVCWMLGETIINCKIKIINKLTGKVPADNTFVSFSQQPLLTLFSDVKITLNDTCVTPNSDNYHYRAYMHNVLNLDYARKNTDAWTMGYAEDTPNQMDDITGKNHGFNRRLGVTCSDLNMTMFRPKSWSYDKSGGQLSGKLVTDFTNSRGLIPNGVTVRYDFTINSDDIILMGAENDTDTKNGAFDFGVVLTDFELMVPTATLPDDPANQMARHLKEKPFLVQTTRCIVTPFNIPTGHTNFLSDVMFGNGVLPSRAIIGIVPNDAYRGKKSLNPFNFLRQMRAEPGPPPARKDTCTQNDPVTPLTPTTDPANDNTEPHTVLQTDGPIVSELKSMTLTLNGDSLDHYPSTPITDYWKLQQYLGQIDTNSSNGISYDMFHKGFAFYAFDFSTSLEARIQGLTPSIRMGNIRAHFNFSEPTPYPLTVLMFAEHPSHISIYNDRRVATSYIVQ